MHNVHIATTRLSVNMPPCANHALVRDSSCADPSVYPICVKPNLCSTSIIPEMDGHTSIGKKFISMILINYQNIECLHAIVHCVDNKDGAYTQCLSVNHA